MSERVHFEITAGNEILKRKLSESQASFRNFSAYAESEGERIDSTFKRIAYGIGSYFTFQAASGFIQKMYQIRSSFQDAESSMRVFLGSAEKAQKFVKELQDYAWYNMFEFSDLTQESTKLLAFGNDVNSIIPILDKLSNIASGTKQPLSEFVDLYNKAKNVGKVDANGLESWANKGVVITSVLEEMGVEVDRSNIKFEHLDMVLNHLTSEGGMFAGLMAEQMSNLSASYGQLEDDIANMFNELGTKYQDAMKSGIEFASIIVNNYESIGKAIGQLVIVYGAYRAALLATYAIQKAVAVYKDIQAFRSLARELGVVTVAQTLFNTAAWMNLSVWIGATIALIGGIAGSIYLWKDSTDETTRSIGEQEQAIIDEHKEVNALVQKLTLANTTESERKRILNQLRDLQPSIVDGIKDEEDAIGGVVHRLKEYNDEYAKRAALGRYQDKVTEAEGARATAGADVKVAEHELEKALNELYVNFDKMTIKKRTDFSIWGGLTTISDEEKAKIKSEIESILTDTELSITERADKIDKLLFQQHKVAQYSNGHTGTLTGFKTYDSTTTSGGSYEAFVNARNAERDAARDEYQAIKNLEEAKESLNVAEGSETLAIKPTEEEAKAVNDYKNRVSDLADEIVRLQNEIKSLRNGGDLGGFNTVDEALKSKQEELDNKEKMYKSLTGMDYDSGIKKRRDAAEAVKNTIQQLALEVSQSEIDAMKEGTTKKLAQIDQDLKKTLAAIDKEERELKKKYKEAGMKWTSAESSQFQVRRQNAEVESNNEREAVEREQTKAIETLYRENTEVFLTEEQKKIEAIRRTYEERRKGYADRLSGGSINQSQYDRLMSDSHDAESQEIFDFVTSNNKTIEQRKQEIIDSYKSIIDAIPVECEENIERANKMMAEELANIDLEELKRRINWDEVFGDFGQQTTLSLQSTLNKLKKFVAEAQAAGTDLSEIPGMKDVVEQITAIQNELDERNPFASMFDSISEISAAKEEVAGASEQLRSAQEAMIAVEDKVKTGELTKDSNEYRKALDDLSKAENRYNVATNKQMAATKKFANALKSSGSIVKSMGTDIADFASVFDEDLGESIKKGVNLFDTLLTGAESIVNAISDVTVKTVSTVENTVSSASSAMTATAAAGAASMSTLEKASVILAVISAALQIATAIAGLFNNDDELQDQIDASKRRVDQLKWEMENLEAVKVDEAIGGWRKMFQKLHEDILRAALITGDFRKILRALDPSSIAKSKESIDKVVKAYANLDYTLGKSIGEDKYAQSRSQLENLAKQQAETYAQMQYEQDKKHTDWSAVEEYQRQIEELGQQMKAVLDDMTEDIIGGTSNEISSQLGNAFFDAFTEGEDAAEAWGKKVDEIVQDIIKRMLITKILEPKIGKIFNDYQDKWFDGEGNFLGIDAVTDSMTSFRNDLNAVGEEFNHIWSSVSDSMRDMFDPVEEATEKNGFATASQESIDELTGRFTAIQIIATLLNASAQERNLILKSIQADIAVMRGNLSMMCEHSEDIRSMFIQSVMYLKDISENTASLVQIEADMKKVKNCLDKKL